MYTTVGQTVLQSSPSYGGNSPPKGIDGNIHSRAFTAVEDNCFYAINFGIPSAVWNVRLILLQQGEVFAVIWIVSVLINFNRSIDKEFHPL